MAFGAPAASVNRCRATLHDHRLPVRAKVETGDGPQVCWDPPHMTLDAALPVAIDVESQVSYFITIENRVDLQLVEHGARCVHR